MGSNDDQTDNYPESRSSSEAWSTDPEPERILGGPQRKDSAVTSHLLARKNKNKSQHPSHHTSPPEQGGAGPRNRHPENLLVETNTQSEAATLPIDDAKDTEAIQEKPVTWRSLPRKDQLLVLALARLSEPLTQTSLGSYIFYQLKSFDPSLPDSTISSQVGIIHAAFPASQLLTAILWGRFADSEYGGRKRVIWFGLLGTMFSSIGFGFSHSFGAAVAFRCLGGVLNGNIGVMRTMISEIIKEKKYQSRAFLLLPMTFNIGVIVGPILGGFLADPFATYPRLFGPDSFFGGKQGVQWMKRWPYALPNLMCACLLLVSTLAALFFMEETSALRKHKADGMLRIGRWIKRHIFQRNVSVDSSYTAIPGDEDAALEMHMRPALVHEDSRVQEEVSCRPPSRLPFKRLWTHNLTTTMVAYGLLNMHVGTFNSLWYVYLSAPRYNPKSPHPPGFHPHGIHFTGGLALPPPRIGFALSILGVMGISLQLLVYPGLSQRLGTAPSFRIFLAFFPLAYILTPFLSIVPCSNLPPDGVSGALVWMSISGVLFIQVLARTFAMPCATILVNNCSPHPSALGTVHGIGLSVSSLTRTFGPTLFGWVFGRGLEMGVVGLGWWILACVAAFGFLVAQLVVEGDGHEILLDGEERGRDGVVWGVR